MLGGGTVFPEWGLSAFPRLGSAVFWYDQESDGTTDHSSIHSGCPPIKGIKWGKGERFHRNGFPTYIIVNFIF